ncbi:MAG: Outer rane efflux protein, partial [Clostridiales bacterium]|nr:Outer rane efflux protein [Clostridiales bacterium]MDN5281041.1 Outer rane efflux protein [Candidatus Ozemobacter sp.]
MKLFRSGSLFTVFLFGMGFLAFAQDAGVKKWSLTDCLEYGIENHPQIKIAESSVQSQKARLKQTRAYWDPKLDLRASWNHRKIDSGGSADDVIDSTSESLGVSKVLYDSGRN